MAAGTAARWRLDPDHATRRFYDLIWPHRADVLRLALFLCRDRFAAEDLAQEALFKAFRAIDRFEGPDAKRWLLTILRNAWTDRMRSRAGRSDVSVGELEHEPPARSPRSDDHEGWTHPQELLEAFSDQQIIDALHELPDEIRWTLLLVDVQGVSTQEAAQVLEVPPGTVKSRAHRGRAMLHELLLPVARQRRMLSGNAMGGPNAEPEAL